MYPCIPAVVSCANATGCKTHANPPTTRHIIKPAQNATAENRFLISATTFRAFPRWTTSMRAANTQGNRLPCDACYRQPTFHAPVFHSHYREPTYMDAVIDLSGGIVKP